MNAFEKLSAIQQELNAPKNRYNSFGEYNYRSLEDINNAVKPLLAKYKAAIILTDEVLSIGGDNVVRACAEFIDPECNGPVATQMLCVYAFAGIAKEKKKLDISQLYGVASSYARKYAMNGLLLIDDTKDADTDEYAKQTTEGKTDWREVNHAAEEIRDLAKKAGVSETHICTQAGVERIEDIDAKTFGKVKTALLAKIRAKEA